MFFKPTKFRIGATLALTALLGMNPPRLAGAPLPSSETVNQRQAIPPPTLNRSGDSRLVAEDPASLMRPERLLWGGQGRSPLEEDRLAAVFVTLIILGCVIGAIQLHR